MNNRFLSFTWSHVTSSPIFFGYLSRGFRISPFRHSSCSAQVYAQASLENVPHESVAELSNAPDATVSKTPKKLKKRFALLLSYLGYMYHGMQFNPSRPSIEGELFKALAALEYISIEAYRTNDMIYNRVSRTDSGVSAVRQVVSLFLPVDFNIAEINEQLPSDIRVIAAQRVSQGFHVQKACGSRTYCYVIPTFAFCPFKAEPASPYTYRIDVDSVYKINDLLKAFLGHHRFHNYTSGRDMMDARSLRRIREFYCSSPYLMEDSEVIELYVTGDSFMLHQIRKMIGMVSAIMRGKAPETLLKETLTSPKLPAPIAPGIGLFLEKVNFENFFKRTNRENVLTWDEHNDALESFRKNIIIPFIVRQERREGIVLDYCRKLRRHSFKDLRDRKVEQEEAAIRREIEEINLIIKNEV